MAENMGKWPSKHRKTYKSGHRMAAKGILFPQLWYGGMISTNLEVIWEMSVHQYSPGAKWKMNSLHPSPPAQVLSRLSTKPRLRKKSKICSGVATSKG